MREVVLTYIVIGLAIAWSKMRNNGHSEPEIYIPFLLAWWPLALIYQCLAFFSQRQTEHILIKSIQTLESKNSRK